MAGEVMEQESRKQRDVFIGLDIGQISERMNSGDSVLLNREKFDTQVGRWLNRDPHK
jgi:hypothetical protein